MVDAWPAKTEGTLSRACQAGHGHKIASAPKATNYLGALVASPSDLVLFDS